MKSSFLRFRFATNSVPLAEQTDIICDDKKMLQLSDFPSDIISGWVIEPVHIPPVVSDFVMVGT